MKNLLKVGLIALSALSLFVLPTSAFAATGTGAASISLSSGSYTQGNTFTVMVKETSSVPVAGIQIDLTYDGSKLQCLGIDGSASAFTQPYPSGCGGGSISIARTTQGTTLTGTRNVAAVTFKVLGSSGTTSVMSANSSEILDANVNNVCNSTCAGGAVLANFSLNAPAPSNNGGDNNDSDNSDNSQNDSGTAPTTKKTGSITPDTNNSDETNSDTTATTNPEVKGDSAENKEGKKNDDKKDETEKTSGNNTLRYFILILVGIAAFFAGRYAARYMAKRNSTKAAAAATTTAAAAKPASKNTKKSPAKKGKK